MKIKIYQIKFTSRKLVVMLLLLSGLFAHGQNDIAPVEWQKMGSNKNVSFYEVQKKFYEYWEGRKIEKGKGYKPFKRWEACMATRFFLVTYNSHMICKKP